MATKGLLTISKDAALSFTARRVLNRYLRGIGSVESLSIDTEKHFCRVTLELVDEDAPIELHVSKYHLRQVDERWMVTLGAATASRRWIAEAWRRFVSGRSIPLPPTAVLNLLK